MSRVLIVANQTLGGKELLESVQGRMAKGPCEFTLLVPATAAPGVAADEEKDYANAERRLEYGLNELRLLGAPAVGEVGDADPLAAIRELLDRRDIDEIIVSTLPAGVSGWLRQDLPHKVQRKFPQPVSVVTAS